eukprot:1590968-Prymnesium_polylepis.2
MSFRSRSPRATSQQLGWSLLGPPRAPSVLLTPWRGEIHVSAGSVPLAASSKNRSIVCVRCLASGELNDSRYSCARRKCTRGAKVHKAGSYLDDRVVVDARVLVARGEQVVEDGALRVLGAVLAPEAVARVGAAGSRRGHRHHVVGPRRPREGGIPAVEDGKLSREGGANRQRAVAEALHDRVGGAVAQRVHRALVLDEAVHARDAIDDVKLGLVRHVVVPRLLGRHVWGAVEDLDAAL